MSTSSRNPSSRRIASSVGPTVTLFEVVKRVLVQRDEGAALRAVAVMGQGQIVDLDTPLVLTVAKLSAELRLPMADRMILATAQHN